MAASSRRMGEPRALPQDYPPAEHVLRDLRLWSDAGAEPPSAGLPVGPALRGPGAACGIGALAVLVDVVAGGAALRAAEAGEARGSAAERRRSWIATSDLHAHWLAPVAGGELVATAEPLRSGRSHLVVEVEVRAAGAVVAHGTVGFARLEARGDYQRRERAPSAARVDWGAGRAALHEPLAERLGAVVRDAAAGAVELPLTPYVGNSLGGLQGGIAAAHAALAAEAAGGARLGTPAAARDLSVHFVAIGRAGPLVTEARVLRRDGRALLVRVGSRDAGAGGRLCTLATAGVSPW